MDDFCRMITEKANMDDRDVDDLSPLVLAYIGDSVYDLFIRTCLVSRGGKKVGSLHRGSIQYVRAGSQCSVLEKISDSLTDEEKDVVRRGRNSNPSTVPRNADMAEYRRATGFEALLGYLYLKKKIPRLMEILGECM